MELCTFPFALPAFNSSPLKSYRNPIGKANVFQPLPGAQRSKNFEFFFPFAISLQCHEDARDDLDDFADEWTSENGGDGSTDAKRWNDAISGMKMEQLEDEDEMCSTAFSTTSYVCPFVEGRLRKKSVYIPVEPHEAVAEVSKI